MNSQKWGVFALALAAVLNLQTNVLFADETGLSVQDIINKTVIKYKDMDGYQAKGEVNTEMDMSGVDLGNIPGIPAGADTDSPLFKSAMQKQVSQHTFEMKLSRSGDYIIQWDQDMNNMIKMSGAAWAKDGKYKMKISSPMMDQPVMEQENRMMGLAAATGVSGGAASTIPSMFYDLEHNTLSVLQDVKRLDDEKLDEEDCYVLSGNTAGQALQFWISKERHLVLQRKHIMGETPNMDEQLTDENIKLALKGMKQEDTPEAVERMRTMMKSAMAMTKQMKGFSIERHTDIKLNPTFAPEDFVPDGIDEKETSEEK